jgi:hypothetical protein
MDPGKLSDPWLKAPSDRRHAADVHVYLPRLSASKSPFKASPALIAQRETQFASFVTVLLGDGLPPALRRLRADRVVRDFFGQREDDYELAQRLPPSFVRSVPPSSVPGVHSGLHTDGVDRPTSLVDSRPPSSFMIPFFVLSETTSLHSADETIRDNESEVLDPALPSKQASVSWFKSPDRYAHLSFIEHLLRSELYSAVLTRSTQPKTSRQGQRCFAIGRFPRYRR